ncbi:MAG: TetR/AcrR family transcriptional regulator [Bacteroidetes bacterium]|nr:TetR/AcrR family transcriptional regulator [Bacteroidota bacterium]
MSDEKMVTEEEQQLIDKILETAHKLFLSVGVRSITMDDLAKELGVSKKTIYQVISNKADLVKHCVQKEIEDKTVKMIGITNNSTDAIEEMLLIGAMVIESLNQFNANIIMELKKFYPKVWLLVEKHHSEFVLNNIKNNLLKGINEGLYRPEINVDIISKLYIGASQQLLEVSDYGGQTYNPSDIYLEFFSYHIRGIASPRGVGKLAIYKNKIKFSI